MARSKAHENLHKLSPILYDPLVHLDLMPSRELATPEALTAALQGGDRLLIDATERAYHRSQDEAKQREHYSGKKRTIRLKARIIFTRHDVIMLWWVLDMTHRQTEEPGWNDHGVSLARWDSLQADYSGCRGLLMSCL